MHKKIIVSFRNKSWILSLLTFIMITNLLAYNTARSDEIMDARHIIDTATVAIEKIKSEYTPKGRMNELIQRTKGILIVPAYYKIGFIVGGSYGDGVLLKRNRNGRFGEEDTLPCQRGQR